MTSSSFRASRTGSNWSQLPSERVTDVYPPQSDRQGSGASPAGSKVSTSRQAAGEGPRGSQAGQPHSSRRSPRCCPLKSSTASRMDPSGPWYSVKWVTDASCELLMAKHFLLDFSKNWLPNTVNRDW